MPLLERGIHPWRHLRALPRVLTPATVSMGFLSATMGVAGPLLLVYQAAQAAGFGDDLLASWLLANFAGGALLGLALSLAYGQPMVGAFSIAGSALLVQSLPGYTPAEAVGAYLAAAAGITLLGLSGAFERVIRAVPVPVVMGMLCGVLLRFVLGLFPTLVAAPLLVGPVLLAYAFSLRWPRRLPAMPLCLAVGVVATLLFHEWPTRAIPLELAQPVWIAPAFRAQALLSLSLPLMLLTLASQNASGIGVLWAMGYRAPVNAITLATGLLSLLAAPLAGPGVNLATPMTALCASPDSHPDPARRYGAVLINALVFGSVGLLGSTTIALIEVLPQPLILAIAGLGLMPVVLTALRRAFGDGGAKGGRHHAGALFALAIAASDSTWLGIGAPFWGLLTGALIARVFERE